MENFSSSKGVRPHMKSFQALHFDEDGVDIHLSWAVFERAADAFMPELKAQEAERELEQINRLLEKAREAEREVKDMLMKIALDPDLTRLALLKRGL